MSVFIEKHIARLRKKAQLLRHMAGYIAFHAQDQTQSDSADAYAEEARQVDEEADREESKLRGGRAA